MNIQMMKKDKHREAINKVPLWFISEGFNKNGCPVALSTSCVYASDEGLRPIRSSQEAYN